MKRTDEMRLGENLRGYCDCNQGRLPCTCKPWHATDFGGYAPLPNRAAKRPEVEMVGAVDPIERFSIAAQLQLMKALAILGWAAFILELLRV